MKIIKCFIALLLLSLMSCEGCIMDQDKYFNPYTNPMGAIVDTIK